MAPSGLGLIRAEADIHPGDWFMVCHFVDDRVMPGTLMYECCLHALRIFMMRLGWIGSRGQVAFEPVPGIANRLKCRGQIVESTRVVAYEVTIKERGYRPEPYAIADALILADGKPIVAVTDMALQLSGNEPARAGAALGRFERRHEADQHGRRQSQPTATPARRPRSSTTTGFSPSRSANRRTPSASAIERSIEGGSSPASRVRPISSSIGSRGSTRNPG